MIGNPYERASAHAPASANGEQAADVAFQAAQSAARRTAGEGGADALEPHSAALLALRLGRKTAGRDPEDATPLESCLQTMLAALGWAGEARHVVEALPHFDQIEQLQVMRAVLARLGYQTQVFEQRLDAITPDQTPCVVQFVDPDDDPFRDDEAQDAAEEGAEDRAKDGPGGEAPTSAGALANAYVALKRLPDGRLDVLDGRANRRRTLDAPRAQVLICRAFDDEIEQTEAASEKGSWFWKAFYRFNRTNSTTLALTLVANVLALATPLFSMAVYNNILISQQPLTLAAAVAVVLGALVLENQVRKNRGDLLASVAARLNAAIVREGFARVMTLPLAMTERASVSVQISRIKQLENVLTAFTSHLASAALDLPFAIVFLIAIGLIAGPLVYMPILLAISFLVLAVAFFPIARRHSFDAGQSGMASQMIIRETLSSLETLQALKAEQAWIERMGAALRRSARAKQQAGAFEQLQHAIAQLMTMIAGVLTLFLGGIAVMEGELSIGGLIAVMMLVWRVLSPIQLAFLSINQVVTARDTIRQINTIMALPTERTPGDMPTVFRRFKGRIELAGVAFRYPQASDLVLRGVTLSVQPGEIIGISGATGAGKSTLLKLLLGLYKPTSGAIYLDGLHLSQLDPAEVRHAIGFAPPQPEFFYGSLAQNVRMAATTASDAQIEAALGAVGVTLEPETFPEGIETRLTTERLAGMSQSLLQQFSLARALAKRAPILLLDDPGALLEPDAELALRRTLNALRGRVTVVIASNRLHHLELCDRVAVLHRGQVGAIGAPADILKPAQPKDA
ncbi:MAG: ATP-binding cassette domain-containing protein [Pseudomonadota bacterium]